MKHMIYANYRLLISQQPYSQLMFILSLVVSFVLANVLYPTNVSAREVQLTDICEIPFTTYATVPDSIQKGKSFRVSNYTTKPSKTYGVTISSSKTEMTATNTNSNVYNQDFLKTDPSPTTGSDQYVAYYPDWVIDATGEVGSKIEIKLKHSISQVADIGKVECYFESTLAVIPIVAEKTDDVTSQPSTNPSVVALRVKVLDSYGRPINDAKVKIDNVDMKTNSDGEASFTNVLSGKKLITAIDGEDRMQLETTIENNRTLNGPAIILRKPTPPLYMNPIFIAGVSATISLLIIIATFVIVKRRHKTHVNDSPAQIPALQGIIQGSLSINQNIPTIIPEPNQPINNTQQRAISPAPWQLPVADFPHPTVQSQTTNMPIRQDISIQSDFSNPVESPLSSTPSSQVPVTQFPQASSLPPQPTQSTPTQDSQALQVNATKQEVIDSSNQPPNPPVIQQPPTIT